MMGMMMMIIIIKMGLMMTMMTMMMMKKMMPGKQLSKAQSVGAAWSCASTGHHLIIVWTELDHHLVIIITFIHRFLLPILFSSSEGSPFTDFYCRSIWDVCPGRQWCHFKVHIYSHFHIQYPSNTLTFCVNIFTFIFTLLVSLGGKLLRFSLSPCHKQMQQINAPHCIALHCTLQHSSY